MKSKTTRIGLTILFVAILSAIWLSACTWEEVKVNMQLNPQEGESYHIRITSDQQITQTMDGEDTAIAQTMGFGCVLTITEVDADGNAWLDMVYDWVRIEQDSEAGEFTYDSSDPSEETPEIAAGFAALLNKGFSMQMSPDGKILALRGIDEMIDGMLEDLEIAEEQRETIKEQLGSQFNEESLKEQFGQMVIAYPEGEVRLGDTWTASMKTSGSLPAIVSATYTLKAYENGIATVEVTSTLEADPEAEAVDMGAYQMRYSLGGVQGGVIKVDIATGWSQSSIITQTMSGDVVFTVQDEEMRIPMAIFSVVKVEMTK
ncbi:MAG: hypothetical protein JXA21_03610 [Anaerolineae bacterium]|nr:hypothetical protein [Anaerolineae bacterium]